LGRIIIDLTPLQDVYLKAESETAFFGSIKTILPLSALVGNQTGPFRSQRDLALTGQLPKAEETAIPVHHFVWKGVSRLVEKSVLRQNPGSRCS
jgi:hypothetical protein